MCEPLWSVRASVPRVGGQPLRDKEPGAYPFLRPTDLWRDVLLANLEEETARQRLWPALARSAAKEGAEG